MTDDATGIRAVLAQLDGWQGSAHAYYSTEAYAPALLPALRAAMRREREAALEQVRELVFPEWRPIPEAVLYGPAWQPHPRDFPSTTTWLDEQHRSQALHQLKRFADPHAGVRAVVARYLPEETP